MKLSTLYEGTVSAIGTTVIPGQEPGNKSDYEEPQPDDEEPQPDDEEFEELKGELDRFNSKEASDIKPQDYS